MLSILTETVVSNVVLVPVKPFKNIMSGGIWVNDTNVVGDALLVRSYGQIEFPVLYSPPATFLSGTFIYGGIVFSHFGHFILESLSRAWFILKNKDIPVVWNVVGGAIDNFKDSRLIF